MHIAYIHQPPYLQHHHVSMSDLFETHREITELNAMHMLWSLYSAMSHRSRARLSQLHPSICSGQIVQFRSEASPLDLPTVILAKNIHSQLAPSTNYHGMMPNSSVSIWVMQALPGIGYLSALGQITDDKQSRTVMDLAGSVIKSLFEKIMLEYRCSSLASSWKNSPASNTRQSTFLQQEAHAAL